MNTWQALKKIVRDQFTRPVPEPWNGKHELKFIKDIELFGDQPSDYTAGWIWGCTCGLGSSSPYRFHLNPTEEQAILSFTIHRSRYQFV